jgi:hypothetical protein
VHSFEGAQAPILYRGVPPARFDDSAFHWLDVTIRGDRMRALLDLQPVMFERDGKPMEWAEIPATPRDDSAAGMGFVVSGKPVTGRRPVVRNISLNTPD